jgi:hypothetical protein
MNIGIASQSAKPRINVLRGFEPERSNTFTERAPVKAGQTILSGQIISLEWVAGNSRYEWVLGAAVGETPFVAFQNSADGDVVSAEQLVGLSCAGQFEIETGFITDIGGVGIEDTFVVDAPVTYDAATGNITVATTGDEIIGRITRNKGYLDKGALGINSSAVDGRVVSFATNYAGVLAL